MKFPRNARIFKGHLDAAPFASVFFCLLIFVLLGTLVYTPGVRIELPESITGLPGDPGPMVAVALGTNSQLYYENQVIRSNELKYRLADEVRKSPDVTLVVRSDKLVTVEQWTSLLDLGRSAGITNFRLAMRPRILESAANPGKL